MVDTEPGRHREKSRQGVEPKVLRSSSLIELVGAQYRTSIHWDCPDRRCTRPRTSCGEKRAVDWRQDRSSNSTRCRASKLLVDCREARHG